MHPYTSTRRAARDLGTDVLGGESGDGKLDRLLTWLYGPKVGLESLRYAPSLVVRSEAQLFGISIPRFAVRVCLGENGFINGRRRELFARAFERTHGGVEGNRGLPKQIAKDNWIADSLLVPPKKLIEDGFHLLTTELGKAYGEGRSIDGTPFLTPMLLSGGLCAQAACFMAMALLHKSVRPVCGVAEITALVQKHKRRLNIGGMTPEEIVRLFRDEISGCSTELQGLFSHEGSAKSRASIALRSYISSGCPVILLVSLSRMFGDHRLHGAHCEPILVPSDHVDPEQRRLVPIRRRWAPTHPVDEKKMSHAVVLVGCHDANDKFIINDPATYPFLSTTIDQILNVRRYRKAASDGQLSESDLGPFLCMAITPAPIRQSLLDLPADEQGNRQIPGLLKVADALQGDSGVSNRLGLTYAGNDCHPGCFRLMEVSNGVAGWKEAGVPPFDNEVQTKVGGLLQQGWYWIQQIDRPDQTGKTAKSLWIWDATKRITRDFAEMAKERIPVVALVLDAETRSWRILGA